MGENGVRVTRLGLVGVGAWARRYLDAIHRRRDCRIVAYARASSRNDDGLPGIRRCASWTDLLELKRQGDLDALIVATTPESQAEITEAAISDGVPILVEKPLGLSVERVQRILRLHRNTTPRVPVLVDFIHLWAPAYRALKARVQNLTGGASAIASIASEGCNRGPFRSWSSLHDYGPHDLAMCLDLLGNGAAFRLRNARKIVLPGNPDGELFEARFDLGGVAIGIRVGNGALSKTRELSVTLTDGRRLVYDDVKAHPFKLLDQGESVAIEETPPLDAVVATFLHFVEISRSGGLRPEIAVASLELSARIAEILGAIDEVVTP